MNISSVFRFCLAALLLQISTCHKSFAQSPPGNAGGDVLITTAELKEYSVTNEVRGSCWRWEPGQTELKTVWSDQPFTIQIPFDMELQKVNGNLLGKSMKVSVKILGFTGNGSAKMSSTAYKPAFLPVDSSFKVQSYGSARRDGRQVYRNDWTDVDSARSLGSTNLHVDCKSYFDGACFGAYFGALRNEQQRDIFNEATWNCADGEMMAGDITGPGNMMFWMVLDPRGSHKQSFAEWYRGQTECTVQFQAMLSQFDWNTKQWKTVRTKDFQVTVKQNGWAIQKNAVWHGGEWPVADHMMNGWIQTVDDPVSGSAGKFDVNYTITTVPPKSFVPTKDYKPDPPTKGKVHVSLPDVLLDYTPNSVEADASGLNSGSSAFKFAFTGGSSPIGISDAFTNVLQNSSGIYLEEYRSRRYILPDDWTAYHKAGQQRVFCLELNYGSTAPETTVTVFGTRLSELGNNEGGTVPAAAAVAETDDGYWDWVVSFRELAREHRSQIQLIRQKLQVLAGQERYLRRQWLALFRLDMLAHEPLGETEDLLDYVKRPVTGGSDIALRPTRTKTQLEAMKQRRDELAAQINGIPAQQEELIQQALRLQKQLTESADVQSIRSKEPHPEILTAVEKLKDEQEILQLRLYEDAKLYNSDKLQQLLQEFVAANKTSDELAKMLTAKIALARADQADRKLWLQAISPAKSGVINDEDARAARAEARSDLKEVLKINPENAEAAGLVREMDLELVGGILAKLEQEKKISMENFGRYLKARGLNPDEPGGWWDCSWEFMKFWWGNGPTSLAAGLPYVDAPGVLENQTSLVADSAAKNQVSLIAIRRLLQRGMPLEKIRNINRDELRRNMTAETTSRATLTDEQVGRLCQDIHETFAELGDLRAIAEGDNETFLKLHSRAYYGTIDSEKTGVEQLTDFIASPASLLMWFGPGAVAKVDGRWVLHSVSSKELAALEEAGSVMTGRKWMYDKLPLKEMGEWIAAKPAGKFLLEAVEADRQLLDKQGAIVRFLNDGNRMAATLALCAGTEHLATEYGGEYLGLLARIITLLGPDEMAAEVFSHAGSSREKLAAQMDSLKIVIAAERKQLDEEAKILQRLESLSQRVSPQAAGGPLTAAEIEELDSIATRVTLPGATIPATLPAPLLVTLPATLPATLPGASPRDEFVAAVTCAAQSLKHGLPGEAGHSLRAARALAGEMKQTLDEMDAAWVQASKIVADSPMLRKVVTSTEFERFGKNLDPGELILGTTKLDGPGGEFLLMGDRAVARGELDKAADLYLAARQQGMEVAATDMRLAMVRFAKAEGGRIAALRAKVPPLTAANPMAETEEQLADLLNSGKVQLQYRPGTANPVFIVSDAEGAKYVFKAIDSEEDVFAECLAPLLLGKVGELGKTGDRAPACRFVRGVSVKTSTPRRSPTGTILRDAAGNDIMDEVPSRVNGVLMRFAEGKELSELCEPQILALKDEMARMRAFRLWLGDCDGHTGNFRFLADGHLSPIDFGFAQLRDALALRQMGNTNPKNQEELLMQALNFCSYVEKLPQQGIRVTPTQMAAYKWVDRIDATLNYDDMESTVTAIKNLCAHNGGEDLKALLRQAHPPNAAPEAIDEAFKVLTERAAVLDKVLKTRFQQFKSPGLSFAPHEILVFAA